MLLLVKAGLGNPVIGLPVSEHPIEVPAGRRQCGTIAAVIAPFGEPAGQICRISARHIVIGVAAECSIRALDAQQPPHRAIGCNAHLLIACLAVPSRQSMEYLAGIECRRGAPVVGDFEPRKAALGQLHGQQELHRPFGAVAETVLRQSAAQGEKGRHDVAGRFGIGRSPSAIEPVAAGNPAIRL